MYITTLLPQFTAAAMYHSYSSHSNPGVVQQLPVQPSMRLQLQQAQNFEHSADLGIQARHQTEQIESGTPTAPTMAWTYLAVNYTWGAPEMIAPEHMSWSQEPSHPTTRHLTRLIPPSENPMPDMGINAGYDSVAVMNMLPQRLTTMHWNIYTDSSNFWQQQEAILPERTQERIASEYIFGAKGTAHPMTLGTSGDTNGDSRLVTFHWQPAYGKWAQAQVLVTDQIRNSMASLWPTDLRLEIDPVGISTVDIQRWIHKNKSPVARIKCASRTERRAFDDLIESLRNCGGYATAGWIIGDSYQTRLLLAPLGIGLLCAAFPAIGIPDPPTSRSHGPDHKKRLGAPSSRKMYERAPPADPVVMPIFPKRPFLEDSYSVRTAQRAQPRRWGHSQAADYPPLDTMGPRQVDFNLFVPWVQETTFAQVRATSPPRLQPGQQAFAQVPVQDSNMQQCQQIVNWNIPSDGSQLDDWQTDTGATGWEAAGLFHGLGSTVPLKGNRDLWLGYGENETTYADANTDTNAIFSDGDAIGSRAGLGLGDGGGDLEDDTERNMNWHDDD